MTNNEEFDDFFVTISIKLRRNLHRDFIPISFYWRLLHSVVANPSQSMEDGRLQYKIGKLIA